MTRREGIDEDDEEKLRLRQEVAAGKVKEFVREQAEVLGVKVSNDLLKQCVQEAAEPFKVVALLHAEVARQKRRQTAAPKSVGYATAAVQEGAKDERPADVKASWSRWAPGAVRRMAVSE